MDEFSMDENELAQLFLMSQLQEQLGKRESALSAIKDIYANDPQMNRSPGRAGMRALIGQPSMGGYGAFSWRPAMEAMNAQEEMNRNAKLAPQLLDLENIDIDPFTKLYQKVKAGQNYKPFDFKVVGDSLIRVDQKNGTPEVVFSNVRNSPLYQKFWDQIDKDTLNDKLRFKSDDERRAYVVRETDKAFAAAVGNDVRRLGVSSPTPQSDTPRELPGAAMTNAGATRQPEEVVTTPLAPAPKFGTEADLKEQVKDLIPETADLPIGTQPGTSDANRFSHQSMQELEVEIARARARGDNKTVAELKAERTRLASGSPRLMTEQQLKTEAKLGQNEADQYASLKDQNSSFISANQSMLPMEGILLSGKHTSGALHEELNKVGGFLNYLDPNGKLAQSAGNDAAYFSNMMNLVRDKIKALGAGTAVSNLDLITTQKSVGDLRNTPQGNMKVIGLMKLFNATMSELNGRKISYFDSNNNTFQGYKQSTEPTHALIQTRHPYGRNTLMSYDVETKDQWIDRLREANGGQLPPPNVIDSMWKRYADESVREIFK